MAFPRFLQRIFANNGAGPKLLGSIIPFGAANPKASGTSSPGTLDEASRADHVHPVQTTISGNAGTATKLAATRSVDGMDFDGSQDIYHYTSCSTAAGTAAKTATLSGFKLKTGSRVTVRFTVTNTAANPTLNVNGTGAKAIRYRNAAIAASAISANRTYEFVYDGSVWQLVGDLDTNTTYTNVTTSADGLMSAADKTKLNGIAAGAQVNPGVATQGASGLMSAADKKKLDGIAAGAQVNETPAALASQLDGPGLGTSAGQLRVNEGPGIVIANDKVQVKTGYGLSLNTDTNELNVNMDALRWVSPTETGLMSAGDKSKLDGMAPGAQANPGIATQGSDGLMSAADKAKLDGLTNNATVSLRSTRASEGDWTISSLIPYKPLYLINRSNNDSTYVDIRIMSGTTTDNPSSHARLGTSSAQCFVLIPTASSVVLRCYSGMDDETVYAYQ